MIVALFGWLVASQPAVLFSHTSSASATSQPAVFFSYNKSASAISHQPAERGPYLSRAPDEILLNLVLVVDPLSVGVGSSADPARPCSCVQHSTESSPVEHGASRTPVQSVAVSA
jgi:hypothetical protein